MSGSGPIVFDYAQWTALFPELDGVAQPQAALYFGLATKYVANPNPYINDVEMLTTLLYLTTAHISRLLSPQVNGASVTSGSVPPSPLVGRIDSATEGSVTVSADFGTQPANAQWWIQTTYGSFAWQLLKPFRLMRFVPAPRRRFNPPIWGGGNGYRY